MGIAKTYLRYLMATKGFRMAYSTNEDTFRHLVYSWNSTIKMSINVPAPLTLAEAINSLICTHYKEE